MKCPYNDCGWCYFPDPSSDLIDTNPNSSCKGGENCYTYQIKLKEQEKVNEKI